MTADEVRATFARMFPRGATVIVDLTPPGHEPSPNGPDDPWFHSPRQEVEESGGGVRVVLHPVPGAPKGVAFVLAEVRDAGGYLTLVSDDGYHYYVRPATPAAARSMGLGGAE